MALPTDHALVSFDDVEDAADGICLCKNYRTFFDGGGVPGCTILQTDLANFIRCDQADHRRLFANYQTSEIWLARIPPSAQDYHESTTPNFLADESGDCTRESTLKTTCHPSPSSEH